MQRIHRTRILRLALCLALLPLVAAAQTREPVGEVGGQPVYRDQLESAHGDPAAQARALFATPALRAYLARHRDELEPDAEDLQRVVAGLERREACAPPPDPRLRTTPETKRMVARFLLGNLVAQKFIHERFGGGRLLFQQAGVEAFDATHRLLRSLEARGDFRVTDPALREQVYAYWTRDHGPFLISEPDAIARALDASRVIAACPDDGAKR